MHGLLSSHVHVKHRWINTQEHLVFVAEIDLVSRPSLKSGYTFLVIFSPGLVLLRFAVIFHLFSISHTSGWEKMGYPSPHKHHRVDVDHFQQQGKRKPQCGGNLAKFTPGSINM